MVDEASSRLRLRAGPMACWLEDGELRDLRLAGRLALLRIYAVARDGRWSTAARQTRVVERRVTSNAFQVVIDEEHTYDATVVADSRTTITGRSDGTIEFAWRGTVRAPFTSLRFGCCFLHPSTCAGQEVEIEHVDGGRETGRFPDTVAPHWPFTSVRAVTTEPAPGCKLEVRAEGEVFEMEDQRNWSDASFKTYCRVQKPPPAYQPIAYRAGDVIEQRITVRVIGAPPPTAMEQPRLRPPIAFTRLPAIVVNGHVRRPFVDLNRDRPKGAVEALGFAVHPQIHLADDRTVVENAVCLGDLARTVRSFAGPARITAAVSFGPGWERRLGEPVAAAWTCAGIAALVGGGADEIAWCSAEERAAGPTMRDVLRVLEAFAGGEAAVLDLGDPFRAAGLALRRDGRTTALVANLQPDPLRIALDREVRARPLEDAPADVLATRGALDLAPYAVARLDW